MSVATGQRRETSAWLWVLFMALQVGCEGTATGPDSGGGAHDSGGDAGPPAPRIQDVLECGTPASAGGLSGVGPDPDDPLQAHFFDPAVFPDALCNDGTPATIYFRPGSDPSLRDRWVIQLMGGGGCRNGDSCAARWCSHMTNFGMTQMTSSVAPTRGTDGEGILQEDRPEHPWAGYNHVLVRYCSSDNWSGTRRGVSLDGHHPLTGAEIRFSVDFLGARILDAMLATLRRDGVPALRWEYAGGVDMPDLDDATEVILAGASAGGGGVARSLDRVAATLRATHCADCPPLVVRGLVDSSYGASTEELDWSTSVLCSGAGICSYEAQMREEITTGGHALWGARMDQSCLDWHAANAPDTDWACADPGHVIENHMSTPFFLRQGLTDTLISGNMVAAMFSEPGGGLITATSFAMRTRDQLLALADLPATAEEGALIAAPGVFGPLCSKHETLRCDAAALDTSIRVDGVDVTMLDVWSRWVDGTGATSVVASSMGDSTCAMSCTDGL